MVFATGCAMLKELNPKYVIRYFRDGTSLRPDSHRLMPLLEAMPKVGRFLVLIIKSRSSVISRFRPLRRAIACAKADAGPVVRGYLSVGAWFGAALLPGASPAGYIGASLRDWGMGIRALSSG